MKARIKKMAPSRRRKTSKPTETLQGLKDTTDKYFAIREVAFDIQALWQHIIKVRNFLSSKDREPFSGFNGYLEATFDRWQLVPVKTEDEYLLDIQIGANIVDEAFIGLARLKYERRNEVKALPPLVSEAVWNATLNLSRQSGVHL